MANTYSQIYLHVVFAVKGRRNSISKNWKDELYKYITGIITNKNQKLMTINGMPDHIHILLGIKPNCNLSDLMRDIKANSSKWINEKQFTNDKFKWQTGFGAFSISQSQIKNVANYIDNQETHHAKKSFKDEYIDFLKAYKIDYRDEYLFSED
ncbi:IS200/IS605 family transposase [uncultured Algibacter sp.]|uniref:IS200/IS605 family transposase n=1 Tax=uncultured Algibacter sp. TaxID=298659 RepID=UPI003217F0BE